MPDKNTPLGGFFSETEPGRKGEILDAAASVFAERGFEGGSMRDIAKRVGVSEPALYRHFPGKEALFLAMLQLAAGRLKAEAFALIDSIEPDHVAEQLAAIFADRRRVFTRLAPIMRNVIASVIHNEQFRSEYRRLVIGPVRARITEKAVIIDATFGVPDADATREARVRSLLALLVGHFISTYMLGDDGDRDVAEAAMRVMCWRET